MEKLTAIILLLLTVISPAFCDFVAEKQNVSFNFVSFDGNDHNITVQGDAYVVENVIKLTRDSVPDGLNNSAGRAYFANPIPLWDNFSGNVASFITYFEFIIQNVSSGQFGDGLAFFMAPVGSQIPEGSSGRWLGLFNESNNGASSNQMVAVEFDTWYNYEWDPAGLSHVGIDVNSIISKRSNNMTKSFVQKTMAARIDYDGRAQKLQVFLWDTNMVVKTDQNYPVLSYDIDLSDFLPADILIGFSASTGTSSVATNHVKSWNFTSTSTSEIFINVKSTKSSIRFRTPILIVAVVVFLTALLISSCLIYRWYKKRKLRLRDSRPATYALDDVDMKESQLARGPRKFAYAQLCNATKNFSQEEKLGQGGFGAVYRGIFRETKEIVAVKRISQESKQGKKEYISEVTIISCLRHRNLVQLSGWCHERDELLLVYQYMPNGSLDKHLFGVERKPLEWSKRYKIACGLASAVHYLHEEWDKCVVHRDVKSSNVMLDSNFNAKLGDFGLARLVEHDQEGQTTAVAGTLGYLAPECLETRKASAESDVFSFGAVALEIATGRRAIDVRLEDYNTRLVDWIWDLYGQNRLLNGADERLNGEFECEEMKQLMVVGLWCSQSDPKSRPTIRQALRTLKFEAPLPQLLSNGPPLEHVNNDLFSTGSSCQSSNSVTSFNSSNKSIVLGHVSSISADTVQKTISSPTTSDRSATRPLLYHQSA